MKKAGCQHQHDDVPSCQPAFRNFYECVDCGTSWEDVWSCACEDDCPNCDTDMEPFKSIEIAPCACEHLEKVE